MSIATRRMAAAVLTTLCLIALGGCGGAVQTSSPIPEAMTETAPQVAATTSTTTTQPSNMPNTDGLAAFTLEASSKAGDKATIEGWFGKVVPAAQSSVPEDELNTCVQASRASAVPLTLTATVQSGVPATVELIDMMTDSLAPGLVEVQRANGEGVCDLQEISFGQLTPNQPSTVTVWLLLQETITPKTPDPSIKLLTEHWRLGVPQVVLNEDHFTHADVTGPQAVTCTPSPYESDSFIAISPAVPHNLKISFTMGETETVPCSTNTH